MAPLSNEIRPVTSCCPPHIGPAVPEVNSVWFKLFIYDQVKNGPPSLLLVKGTRLRWLPKIFEVGKVKGYVCIRSGRSSSPSCCMKRLGVFLLPQDGMLVHRRVTPIHLYAWMERGTVRVEYLAQEHNTMSRPVFEPRPSYPESSTLTMRLPRLHRFLRIQLFIIIHIYKILCGE